MKRLKILLLLTGLIAIWTVSSAQSPDSLYSLPISKARQLVKIALQAQSCDSLARYQEIEINKGIRLQTSSDSLAEAYKKDLRLTNSELDKWRTRYSNQVALTKIEKKKKRKWIFIAIGAAALGIITNLN